jgi:hypothetical protein
MSKRRDRHERGMRGPLAPAGTIPKRPLSRTERFASAIEDTLELVAENCPQALQRIDVGYEDVPAGPVGWDSRVPLAAAVSATSERHGQVILYQRPIERRAPTPADLRKLVQSTIVEQLSAITGFPPEQLDPTLEER